MQGNRFLSVGYISFDRITSPEGNIYTAPGGAALYSSLAASRFIESGIIATVGIDFPDDYMKKISQRIDTSHVRIYRGKTPAFWIKYDKRWDESYEKLYFGDEDITDPDKYRNIQTYMKTAEIFYISTMPPDKQERWVNICAENRVRFAIDTNLVFIDEFRDTLLEFLKQADVFFLNHREALSLSGRSSTENAGKWLSSRGNLVVIKLGSQGAMVFDDEDAFRFPSVTVSTRDTTGAGDSFAGAFLGSMIKNKSIEQAGKDATKIAALVVSSPGPFALIDGDKIEEDMEI